VLDTSNSLVLAKLDADGTWDIDLETGLAQKLRKEDQLLLLLDAKRIDGWRGYHMLYNTWWGGESRV
jgi:hypothetical protein